VCLGCLLWCLVPIAIFNTERISAKQGKMRFKAQRYAVHLEDAGLEPFDELNGRIVYVNGTTECTESLCDDKFGKVKSEGKIKLRRRVEMYQHVEHEQEEGEGDNKRTVYTYTQEWCDDRQACNHDQSGQHQNPAFPIPSTRRQHPYRAWCETAAGEDCVSAKHENVHMGKYYLDDFVIREMNNWQDKEDLTDDMLKYSGKGKPVKNGSYWYYDGASEGNAQVGGLRIKFEELHTGKISICGVLAKNKNGWSFVPIVKKDAQGACDSLVAECGTSCCFSPETLRYSTDDEEDVKYLKEQLDHRAVEYDHDERKKLARSGTMMDNTPENDMDDLCCTGLFGQGINKLMHWIGLEDEFLAVAEEDKSLNAMIQAEAEDMEQKVSVMRAATWCCLVIATLLIINPIMKLLNYNWLVTMLGGGLLSCIICCCAMMCTCSAYMLLVSSAWIWWLSESVSLDGGRDLSLH